MSAGDPRTRSYYERFGADRASRATTCVIECAHAESAVFREWSMHGLSRIEPRSGAIWNLLRSRRRYTRRRVPRSARSHRPSEGAATPGTCWIARAPQGSARERGESWNCSRWLASKGHPLYQQSAQNAVRQSISCVGDRDVIGHRVSNASHVLIKAFNAHTVALLHETAGQYRTRSVRDHQPPPPDRVPLFMDYFVNIVNWYWQSLEAICDALWRINYIHPSSTGTAGLRAPSATSFSVAFPIVPELLRREPARTRYFAALRHARGSERRKSPVICCHSSI